MIMHLNICVIERKPPQIEEILRMHKVGVLEVCKTHLGNREEAPEIRGYKCFGRNGTRRERGVGFYVRSDVGAAQIIEAKSSEENSRIILIQIGGRTFIEAYAPVECATGKRGKISISFWWITS